MSNEPKVLVEFSPEEITWLADRLHEIWGTLVTTKAIVTDESAKLLAERHKEITLRVKNRIEDKAKEQGFGHL